MGIGAQPRSSSAKPSLSSSSGDAPAFPVEVCWEYVGNGELSFPESHPWAGAAALHGRRAAGSLGDGMGSSVCSWGTTARGTALSLSSNKSCQQIKNGKVLLFPLCFFPPQGGAGGNPEMPGWFGEGCGCQREGLDAGRITRRIQNQRAEQGAEPPRGILVLLGMGGKNSSWEWAGVVNFCVRPE